MAEIDDLTAVIEADMLANMGGEENVSGDPASAIRAKVYANAKEVAYLQLSSRVAGRQYIPTEATDLLPKLEWEHDLVPKATDDLATRQTAVAVAAKLTGGASRANVVAVLTSLLGSDFIAYVTRPKSDLSLPALNAANYVKPGTPAFVGRTIGHLTKVSGPAVVQYERVGGRVTPLQIGETILIDPGITRPEVVELQDVTETTFTAEFTLPHAGGTVFTTGRSIWAPTTLRHNVIVLTSAAARDAEIRRKVNVVLRKLLRATSTWSIVEQVATGQAGPFIAGVSLPLVTPIAAITYPVGSVGAHAGAPASSPLVTGGATSKAVKAAAASSAPTITANATKGFPAASSSPSISGAATSKALKAVQASAAGNITGGATSQATKKSQGISAPLITVGAGGTHT